MAGARRTSRILLVEDDPNLRMLLEHVLLGAGHKVDAIDSVAGASALLAEDDPYDLVIADGRLPDGTGMMVVSKAAELGAKTLIITGYAFDLPREELSRYEFLLKPIRPAELLDAVERALAS